MATSGTLTFTTAHRVIQGIHSDPTDMRATSQPATPTGLSDTDIFMIFIAYDPDRGITIFIDLAHFA